MPKKLDAYNCELSGRHIVSAGAGTGKTYNIQILALREILQGTPIEQILLVTFTNLATEELQDRLRRIIQDALHVCLFLNEQKEKNPGFKLSDLSEGYEGWDVLRGNEQVLPCFHDTDDLDEKRCLLQLALRNFDSAPVFTIHGFCSRMLEDNAFESCMRYGLEIRKSCSALQKYLMVDFFRKYTADVTEGNRKNILLSALGMTPSVLLKELEDVFSNPEAEYNWSSSNNVENELQKIETSGIWTDFCDLLQKKEGLDNDFFEAVKGLHGTKCRKIKAFLNEENLTYLKTQGKYGILYCIRTLKLNEEDKANIAWDDEIFTKGNQDKIDYLKGSQLLKAALRLQRPLPSELGGNGEPSVAGQLKKYRELFIRHAYSVVSKALGEAKQREGFITYDDLLLQLKNKLADERSRSALRAVIREKFKCVMIDEFQDTDPCQAAIFKSLFGEKTDSGHSLFFIGDEKQAIYMFRGGDVQTFQAEASDIPTENHHTLSENFRSSADFIQAMNTFWQAHKDFFAPLNIEIEEILPGKFAKQRYLADKDDKKIEEQELLSLCKVKETSEINSELAREIRNLIDNGVRKVDEKGSSPLAYHDIAILVCSKKKVPAIREALAQKGIRSVFLQGQNIFKAEESRWMKLLIEAVLHPEEQAKVLALLASQQFGFSAEALDTLRGRCLADMQMYMKYLNEQWGQKSFFYMFHEFWKTPLLKMMPAMKECPILFDDISGLNPAQLLLQKSGAGEETLSIVQQLAETLMAVASERNLGGQELLTFLAGKIRTALTSSWGGDDGENTVDEADDDDEEYPVHLTTQVDAVSILTIHKSKGLEYPVVFVPGFRNMTVPGGKKNQIYHEGKKRIINVVHDNEAGKKCNNETMAEIKRLMYVAITRAVYLCRFISQGLDKEDSQRPDSLLPEAGWWGDVDNTGDSGEKETCVLKADEHKIGSVFPGWVTTSFSDISQVNQEKEKLQYGRQRSLVDLEEKHDEALQEERMDEPESENEDASNGDFSWGKTPFSERKGVFRFPSGKRTGTCWHEILEHLDYCTWAQGVEDRTASWNEVEKSLVHYGQLETAEKEERKASFANMLVNVCNYPLQFQNAEVIRLCELDMKQTAREMKFTYRIREGIEGNVLKDRLLKLDGIEAPEYWCHSIGRVNLTGSLDLLFQNPANQKFYIIDWKTNILSGSAEAFDAEGINAEMNRHFYKLQCVIYTLAFTQYYMYLKHGYALNERSREAFLKEAYGQFGGCADIFLRGVDSSRKRGVHYVTPSWQLIKELDQYIGIRID